MTIKEFLRKERIHISYKDRDSFGIMVSKRAKKNEIVFSKKEESKFNGKFKYFACDYPEDFIPVIKKIYKQFDFIKKSQLKSNTS